MEDEGQASRPPGWSAGTALSWSAAWAAVLALAMWLSRFDAMWLWAAGVGSGVWLYQTFRAGRSPVKLVAGVTLGIAVATAVIVQGRLTTIVTDWGALQLRIEERSAAAVESALNRLLDDGERAVAAAEAAAAAHAGSTADPELFERLAAVQHATGVTAIVLFDSTGTARAWSGQHRGTIPVDARTGAERYIFHEGPLFSYLYFVRPFADGMTAAAAFLLEGTVEPEEGVIPFADRFEREHGPRPRFWIPERAPQDPVWDWATEDGRPIFSVGFIALTQEAWWQRVAEEGRRAGSAALLGAFVVLSVAWYRDRRKPQVLPAIAGTVALLIVPHEALGVSAALFSPLQFVLPGPLDVTLGSLLILLAGCAVALLGWRSKGAFRPLTAVALMALVMVMAVVLVRAGASDALLPASPAGGFALQMTTVLLAAVPVYLILRGTSPPSPLCSRPMLWIGTALPALLAVLVANFSDPTERLPVVLAAGWAIPALLLLGGMRAGRRTPGSLRLWLAAGWLASTLALGFLWPMHVRAELGRAGRDLAGLGTQPDAFLDYLLRQFAEQTRQLAADGERGVNLMYHAWMNSGLAREGYEARISTWIGGDVEVELNLSDLGPLPQRAIDDVMAAPAQGSLLHYGGVAGLQYLLAIPLEDGRVVSVAVPPRRNLAAVTPLARFLYPETESRARERSETLYLVPVDTTGTAAVHAAPPVAGDTVHWVRSGSGWRSEALVELSEGPAHAHLIVAKPGFAILLTRAVLVALSIQLALGALWLVGKLLRGGVLLPPSISARWFRSFRGRLTVALFVFFLLPTVVLGVFAYGAVAREVIRSAAALAQQALDQAAARPRGSTLTSVRTAVETDLLLYRDGTIVAASAPEVIDLGLFPTWLPPDVFLDFATGEELQELQERRHGESEYLVAYRRLDAASVLAAPIPLASNEIRRRQQEFRDISLLMTLAGLGLSVILALLVGRALARPLDELSRAAATVGSGNLRTRLPETRSDEFGNVYASFNRMVARLGGTRAALVKETRRTETIVAEAATGVLALDAQSRIELINPRAAEILGDGPLRGEPLTPPGRQAGPIAAAIAEMMEAGKPESAGELEVDSRIVRIKLRRLPSEYGGGGAVVSLEDVTAEVRTARVIAWGEMARQVAHEIKNPLTPIKLAVQHLRRAFIDQRPEFGSILDRNVDSILTEIDRLSEISRAFSRFGTPEADQAPLELVDVQAVIGDVMALYHGSDGGATFRAAPVDPVPLVHARSGELKEVLLNLLENAREAVDEAGEVVVSAEVEDFDGSVVVAVSDDGVGIPEDELPRIFEPRFSTRSSGTGLGLAIVRRFVESWGATLQVRSAVGKGTRVEVRFPPTDEGQDLRPE